MRNLKRWTQALSAAIASTMWTALAFAQDPAGDVTTTTTSTTQVWYGQWWVWAVGVAVFLIIVIALTNRGGQSRA
jgi:hypothetical protein